MSAVGLYGLVSYSVSQRAREFGVRTALGASSGAVLRLVLAQGLGLAATGAAIGLAGSLATARLTRSLLYGVAPGDPLTLAGVASAVCGVSLLAAWIPARRATRVDPTTSLRRE
jgi:ABC-type antimicrobial peptide transport system permease subunit